MPRKTKLRKNKKRRGTRKRNRRGGGPGQSKSSNEPLTSEIVIENKIYDANNARLQVGSRLYAERVDDELFYIYFPGKIDVIGRKGENTQKLGYMDSYRDNYGPTVNFKITKVSPNDKHYTRLFVTEV